MPPPLKSEDAKALSTDVQYLYRMARAISEGFCPEDLSSMKPGQIVNSRWLTKASRILRLYVTTNMPSINLKTLAIFVIKAYVPMYFNVKFYNSVVYGSLLVFKFIKSTRYLPPTLRETVDKVITTNSFFAHPENILLTMLFDDRKTVRERAIRKILHYRDNLCDSTKLRAYKKPAINFDCTDYFDMVDLDNDSLLSEPPFTFKIPYEHLLEYIEFDDPPLPDPEIPMHIQGTERCVQLLTNVCGRVMPKNRDDVMAVVIESRATTSRMDSKQDFKS